MSHRYMPAAGGGGAKEDPGALRIGAAYVRVSTDDQLEVSPESQLEEIRTYCERNNILLRNEYVFIEAEGKSGRRSENREAFQRMIATAKTTPRPFDVIVLWKFSRFARNQDESTFYKSMLRKKLGIEVVSVSEPLIEGMYGRLIEMIIEWQDEFYSVNLSAEVLRSMKYKAERGQYNGKMPLGYHKERGENPVIVESEALIVRTIFDMYTSGTDIVAIARYLNERGYTSRAGKPFDQDSVTYILENPFYIGKVRWNRRQSPHSHALKDPSEWIIADSFHPAIVDNDTWEAAQKRIALVRKTREAYAHPVSHGKHWLSGLVKCSICGKSLSYKAPSMRHDKRRGYDYLSGEGFQCLGYRKGLHSESQFVSRRKLEAAVLSSLREVLGDADAPFELIRTVDTQDELVLQIYEDELSGLARKEQRIKEAYMNGVDTLEDYSRGKKMISARREQLCSLIDAMKKPELNPADYRQTFLNSVYNVISIIESDAPYTVKGEALRGIVKRIDFDKEKGLLTCHYFLEV